MRRLSSTASDHPEWCRGVVEYRTNLVVIENIKLGFLMEER